MGAIGVGTKSQIRARVNLDGSYPMWLVWRSGNGIGHSNKDKLHRARLVLGLVTTFEWSTISETASSA